MSNLLSQKAILASITLRSWTARRIDKRITNQVNREHGASDDAGRYNKLLIAKEALEPLSQIRGKARTAHMEMTLPWCNDGPRILATALYSEYANKMRVFREEHDAAADEFAKQFPSYVSAARRRLNGMFREADYPRGHEIRRMFGFDLTILPCPDAKDFRVDLASEHVEDMRADLEKRMHEALDEAMRDPVNRIIATVGHMAERLRAYRPSTGKGDRAEGTFRDSLVQNVRDLVDLLPAFNLTGDRALAAITERMKRELCSTDPDALRDNSRERKRVAAAAEAILNQANQLMA